MNVMDMVEEFTIMNTSFTAYDITISLRNSGVHINHSEVRKKVHDAYHDDKMDSGYEKTAMKLPNGKRAFVYHHITADLDDYESVVPANTNIQPMVAVPHNPKVKNCQPVNGVLIDARAKSDGRLTIPKTLIKDCGLLNKNFKVVNIKKSVVLVRSTDPDYKNEEEMSPQTNGTIELPKKYLTDLNKTSYVITLIGDRIFVS